MEGQRQDETRRRRECWCECSEKQPGNDTDGHQCHCELALHHSADGTRVVDASCGVCASPACSASAVGTGSTGSSGVRACTHGSGLESLECALGIGVQGEDHAVFAVGSLCTVEPHWGGVVDDCEGPFGDGGCVGCNEEEAGVDTVRPMEGGSGLASERRSDDGYALGYAWVVKSRLGRSLIDEIISLGFLGPG